MPSCAALGKTSLGGIGQYFSGHTETDRTYSITLSWFHFRNLSTLWEASAAILSDMARIDKPNFWTTSPISWTTWKGALKGTEEWHWATIFYDWLQRTCYTLRHCFLLLQSSAGPLSLAVFDAVAALISSNPNFRKWTRAFLTIKSLQS